jgi:hypothetical protein
VHAEWLPASLPFTAELDAPTARLLDSDGSRTQEALGAALDDDEARERRLEPARRMLSIGFLVLVEPDDGAG